MNLRIGISLFLFGLVGLGFGSAQAQRLQIWVTQIEARLSVNQSAEAQGLIALAMGKYPNAPELVYLRARAFEQEQKLQSAWADLYSIRREWKLVPEYVRYTLKVGFNARRYAEAEDVATAYLNRSDAPGTSHDRAEIWAGRASLRLAQTPPNAEGALNDARAALALNSRQSSYLTLEIDALLALQRWGEVLERIARQPDSLMQALPPSEGYRLWYAQGLAHMQIKQPDSAIVSFSRALQTYRFANAILPDRARAYAQLGQLEMACADIARYRQLEKTALPADLQALNCP
jgi:tetratricopeptide (TPR) repeat protein